MNYNRVLQTALERLRDLPPVRSVKEISNAKGRLRREIDALVDIETDHGVFSCAIEVKPVLKRPLPQHLPLLKKDVHTHFLLVSEYVNPSIAESLKREGISFIDSQGNAYINVPGFIYRGTSEFWK